MSLRQNEQLAVSGLASWSDVLPPIIKGNAAPPTEGSDDEKIVPVKKTSHEKIVPVKKTSQVKHSKPTLKKPRRPIPEIKQYLPEEEQPNEVDVIGGRGGRSNHHPGNRPYWLKILEARHAYKICETDAEKCRIAQDILDFVKGRGGRFLNLEDSTKRWFELPDLVVLDKAKQALRDKYVPYWAKNIEVRPLVANNSATSGRSVKPNKGNTTDRGDDSLPAHGSVPAPASTPAPASMPPPASTPPPSNATYQQRQQPNSLDFLLAASRAYFGPTSGEVIPSVDDILKCKIDTLPPFDQRQRAAAALAAAANAPFTQSLGMGDFHSVDFMSSLGGGAGSLATGHIGGNVVNTTTMSSMMGSLGGAFGGPFIGGMPGHYGAPPSMAEIGASLALRSLDFKSLDQFMDNQPFNATAGRSLDLMNLTASQGGFGSLGGVSGFQLPPLPARRVTDTTGDRGTVSAGSNSSSGASNGSSKTDWNAMYAKALGNPKPI